MCDKQVDEFLDSIRGAATAAPTSRPLQHRPGAARAGIAPPSPAGARRNKAELVLVADAPGCGSRNVWCDCSAPRLGTPAGRARRQCGRRAKRTYPVLRMTTELQRPWMERPAPTHPLVAELADSKALIAVEGPDELLGIVFAAYRTFCDGRDWDPEGGTTSLDSGIVQAAAALGQLIGQAGAADYAARHPAGPGLLLRRQRDRLGPPVRRSGGRLAGARGDRLRVRGARLRAQPVRGRVRHHSRLLARAMFANLADRPLPRQLPGARVRRPLFRERPGRSAAR